MISSKKKDVVSFDKKKKPLTLPSTLYGWNNANPG